MPVSDALPRLKNWLVGPIQAQQSGFRPAGGSGHTAGATAEADVGASVAGAGGVHVEARVVQVVGQPNRVGVQGSFGGLMSGAFYLLVFPGEVVVQFERAQANVARLFAPELTAPHEPG